MGTVDCPCGRQLSDVQVPTPYLYRLVPDEKVDAIIDGLVDDRDDSIVTWSERVFECPACFRLLRFAKTPGGREARLHVYRLEK